MKMRPKTLGLLLGKVGLSAFLMWLILRRVDFASIAEQLSGLRPVYLIPVIPMAGSILVLSAWRWYLLAEGLVSFGAAFLYTWIGLFYGALLPGAVTGDLAKGAILAARDRSTRVSRLPISILMDRIMGLVALLVLFTTGAAISAWEPSVSAALHRAALAAAAAGIFVLAAFASFRLAPMQRNLERIAGLWPHRWGRSTALKLSGLLVTYARNTRLLASTFAISLAIHGVNVALCLLFFAALHQHLTLASAVVMYSALSVLVMIPISISAIGVRDWFALLYFQSLHLPPSAGVAFSWLNLTFSLALALGGGLVQLSPAFPRAAPPAAHPS